MKGKEQKCQTAVFILSYSKKPFLHLMSGKTNKLLFSDKHSGSDADWEPKKTTDRQVLNLYRPRPDPHRDPIPQPRPDPHWDPIWTVGCPGLSYGSWFQPGKIQDEGLSLFPLKAKTWTSSYNIYLDFSSILQHFLGSRLPHDPHWNNKRHKNL